MAYTSYLELVQCVTQSMLDILASDRTHYQYSSKSPRAESGLGGSPSDGKSAENQP